MWAQFFRATPNHTELTPGPQAELSQSALM